MSSSQSPICRYWQNTGNCFYGEQCNFSHSTGGGGPVSAAAPDAGGSKGSPQLVPKSQRPCRNIAIHGYCKNEGKGCEFNHTPPPRENTAPVGPGPASLAIVDPESNEKLTFSPRETGSATGSPAMSPGMGPGAAGGAASAGQLASGLSVAAGNFVPGGPGKPPPQNVHPGAFGQPGMVPITNPQQPAPGMMGTGPFRYQFATAASAAAQPPPSNQMPNQMMQPPTTPPRVNPGPPAGSPDYRAAVSGAPTVPQPGPGYFVPGPQQGHPGQHNHPKQNPAQPTQPQSGHQSRFAPSARPQRRNIQSLFMSDNFRNDLAIQHALSMRTLDYSDPSVKDIPYNVGRFHSLYPLDDRSQQPHGIAGFSTTVFKGISSTDGVAYALRKFDTFRPSNDISVGALEGWKKLHHPGIVNVREVFTTKEFSDKNSLCFVYDYYPGAESLEQRYLSVNSPSIPEPVLWSYICQLVSALRCIHMAGLACRVLEPHRVLLTGNSRVRINCCGIMDVMNEPAKPLPELQYEDLCSLGKLIVLLTCKNPAALQNLTKYFEVISKVYSPALRDLVVYLLAWRGTTNIMEVCNMIAPKMLAEYEQAFNHVDVLENELAREMENGRISRLLIRLGFVNERPEYDMDPQWSETGDRYLLKLFRDYAFHQVNENGDPVIDYGHVVETLNKLDAGVQEKVCLMSRDEKSVLVVSYKDLKRCVEGAFHELMVASGPPHPHST
eukprot:GFYU01007519.1.p1 GENE.GFYU01007519.1~~GFYU01007519.1.p1  ORF type:complete len:722 (-),score=117.90 GFYU01007519.1:43-2208(-)